MNPGHQRLWRFPARTARVSEVRDRVMEWSRDNGLSGESADALRLALGEALGNAVVHGSGDGELVISARIESPHIVIDLESPGAFHPQGPPTMPDPSAEAGRGLALMSALLDKVEYLPSPGKTKVRMRKSINPAS